MIDDFFSGHDDLPGSPGEHRVIPKAYGNGIPPAVRFQGMKDGHIRANGLGHYHLFSRIKGVVFNLEVGAVLQKITSQKTTYCNIGEPHGSSLDH